MATSQPDPAPAPESQDDDTAPTALAQASTDSAALAEADDAATTIDFARLAKDISEAYRLHRQASPVGRIGFLGHAAKVRQLLRVINKGLSPTQAAYRIGSNPITITEHYEQGVKDAREGKNSASAMFAAAVEIAKATIEERLLACIDRAALKEQHWTAAAWRLERSPMFGNRYKLQQVTGGGQVIVQIGISANELRIAGGESQSETPHNIIDALVIPANP